MMRRCLCSLPSYVEVQKLCECLGLDAQTAGGAVGGRAVLHARVLGLSVEELTALGEEVRAHVVGRGSGEFNQS